MNYVPIAQSPLTSVYNWGVEWGILGERVNSGLENARRKGIKIGRPETEPTNKKRILSLFN